jgi:hypothetical protein
VEKDEKGRDRTKPEEIMMNQNECQARLRYSADRLAQIVTAHGFMGTDAEAIEDVAKSLYSMSFEGGIVLSELPGIGLYAMERLIELVDQEVEFDTGYPGDKGLLMVLRDCLEKEQKPREIEWTDELIAKIVDEYGAASHPEEIDRFMVWFLAHYNVTKVRP